MSNWPGELDDDQDDIVIEQSTRVRKTKQAIDFDLYDKQSQEISSNARVLGDDIDAATRSTLDQVPLSIRDTDDISSRICIDEVTKLIPRNVLRTFQPDETFDPKREHESSESIATTLYAGLRYALHGNSVVTVPLLYKDYEWLGSIVVRPGELRGNTFVTYRAYWVQAEVLAAGHVLPWKIGRELRYSELRKVLVDDLQLVVSKYEMDEYYDSLFDRFPPKHWQSRNTNKIAESRSNGIEMYINKLFEITNSIIRARDTHQKQHRGKRAPKGMLGSVSKTNDDVGGALVAAPEAEKPAATTSNKSNIMSETIGEGIPEIINLIVSRLLNIDRRLCNDISQLSQDLGALITATPSEHSHVTKDFRVTPQQAL